MTVFFKQIKKNKEGRKEGREKGNLYTTHTIQSGINLTPL
jgi:hypothetical protein